MAVVRQQNKFKKRYSKSLYGYTQWQDIYVNDEFISFFHNHSNKDVCTKYNLSIKGLQTLCKSYNLYKTKEDKKKLNPWSKKNRIPWNKGLKKGDPKYSCEWITEEVSLKKSKSMLGKNRGKKHSDESKQNMKEGWIKFFSSGKKRKPFSNETLKNMKNAQNSLDVKEKILNTKIANGTLNTSKPQKYLEEYLKLKYGDQNVEVEYNKDPRYPFRCDFYIKNFDLFIEYNGFWTHGKHLYNKNSISDLVKAARWKRGSEFEQAAFYNWTQRDIKKYNYIKKLNHIWAYTIEEIFERLEVI